MNKNFIKYQEEICITGYTRRTTPFTPEKNKDQETLKKVEHGKYPEADTHSNKVFFFDR